MEGSNAKRGQRSRRRRGGRPTKAEAALVEDRILAIAAELFARDGYAATSVERVASMCGAGKDTIYRRYASKRALFNAVLERSRKRIMARLDDLGAGSAEQDSLAQLRELTSCLLDINLDPELIAFKRIALSEMLIADSDRIGPEADAISDLLRARVVQAQKDRHLVAADATFLTNHLINSIIVGPTTLAMFGYKPLPPADRKAYFKKAWKLFLGGADATGSSD
ncbi:MULTISPECIES: TetR/AcrR family transcriptional regulator [Bradyrhizobium]|jgi:TetR/AcrR family transcriptional regulator of autoinduction and epiphytic fitness|uniref:TetR/AcrR family transcriptional regulator n=1 Tax=Bradyrhizobium TaxID=374 RepID=UPI000414D9B4|nr:MULTISPECIES: TetR/AcrR family transcriptional regulator [Bradyrhizobium]KIU52247.1 hypothetical protein QU41_03405 [Bradyrhizobium elkanii]MBK5655084.1 TetR/AcrR family transcriptional regulator [Rhizobium sp.]OCX32946.1 hypothetical protein QU42_01230 [Bradyrhizobium sp. UASWS1016]